MMRTKLILDEAVDDVIPEEEVVDFNISSFVTNLIKSKWEQVDNINGMILTLQGNDDVINTLKDIISDEYIHIGQLEKVVKKISPEATGLDEVEVEEITNGEPLK